MFCAGLAGATKYSSSTTISSAIRNTRCSWPLIWPPGAEKYNRPFSFYTEASIDLADRPDLLAAMVEANFMYVFIGIETPSAEALKCSKKFQNLRKDNLEQVRIIQESGFWVLAGFIVGFDSDDETIFERQRQFIERTAITWAMAGILQAPPTTPLYRPHEEGRPADRKQRSHLELQRAEFPDRHAAAGAAARPELAVVRACTSPRHSSPARSFRWNAGKRGPSRKPPALPMSYNLRLMAASMWTQGVRSEYRARYWAFLGKLIRSFCRDDTKIWMGIMVLLSAHHFLIYARQVAAELERDCRAMEKRLPPGIERKRFTLCNFWLL